MLKKVAIALLFLLPVSCFADTFWTKTTWTTKEGILMVGLYHPSSRPDASTWVLLHGLGSNKEEWESFAKDLAKQGNGVFLYDARGHHESVRMMNGGTISYQAWQTAGPGSPWDAMPSDLESAVTLLHEKRGIPLKSIAVGGASLGANVALVYAGLHPQVPVVVLLSPGLEYAGIQTVPALKGYQGRPLFMAASPGDRYAYASVQQLNSLFPHAATKVMDGKGGHGVEMLKDEEFRKALLNWMKTR